MTDTPLLLTLVVPTDVSEAVLEALLELPDLAPGFTTSPAEGLGAAMRYTDATQAVRGRAAYLRIEMLLDDTRATALLARLKPQFANPRIFYWLTPSLGHGRFG
jgi:hypothetical protein